MTVIVRNHIVERRAHTDASLGAERSSTDVASDRTAARVQRVLDDLIERDRTLADEQLLKFRKSADDLLARDRSASPARGEAVAIERGVADAREKAEREVIDALLEHKRQKADSIVEREKLDQEADRATLDARRHDTDDQLSTERTGADVAVVVLDETQSALAHAENDRERRGDVLAMVAHDLRSPLRIIAVKAHDIAEASAELSTRESANEVCQAAARMERLLQDLLDVARIESETLRIVKREHDVGALLREISRLYSPLFADRGMIFNADAPDGILVPLDHDRMVQVFSNLLTNAMKFVPRGGTVSLRVERQSDRVAFVLSDSGPGIDPTALPHVFKRFWQMSSDSRRGLGLGLYICEKIVQAHGGSISVESGPGKGTMFRLDLPASQARSDGEPALGF